MMRSRLFALVALCAALSCRTQPTEKRITFIPKGRTHLFWQSVHAGAVAAAEENPGYRIVWNGPASETDYEGQVEIMESAINQHVDAICVAPIDRRILVAMVERATNSGIPVIVFDSPVDTDVFTSQVATNNTEGGLLAGDRMGTILGGKGKVAEVAVQPGSASTMAREQGFEDKLKEVYPGVQLVAKQYGMADFAQSLKVAENMIAATPDLNGMFASNESSSVGAVRALKDRRDIKLVGFDSSPQLVEALRDGTVDSLVVQDPFQMGYKSMVAAVTKLKGGSPEHIQNIRPTLVTRDNVDTPEIQKKINPDLDKYLK
jgi:ribose transport system substrate-binding protein